MKKYGYFFSAFFLIFSYISPIHYNPWAAYVSIISAIFCLLSLVLILEKKIKIPVFSLFILLVATIVWIQYYLGLVFYLNTAIIVSSIIILFWLSFIIGYNFSLENKDKVLIFLGIVFIVSGIFSTIFSIFQWIQLDKNPYLIIELSGRSNRMVANIGQANQLATLLFLSIISCFYFFEKSFVNKYILSCFSVFFLFGIVLTQSRTAWIVVIVLFIYFILFYKKLQINLKPYIFCCGIVLFFITIIFLPKIIIVLSGYLNVAQTDTVLERMSSGYLRINIWQQMIGALLLEPWLGYGWFQTSVAQYAVIDRIHGVEWTTSAHNIILDLLVWNGVLLGFIIILYIFYYFILPIFRVKNIQDFFAAMLIITFGIHAMLEYPIFYTYFLIPLGLVIGLLLAGRENKGFCIHAFYMKILLPLALVFIYFFNQQYNFISYNIVGANLSQNKILLKDRFIYAYETPLFDNFNAQIKWIALNPYQKFSKQELVFVKQVVSLNLTQFNLNKFAIVLAVNGEELECRRVLKILEVMYGVKISYGDIILKIKLHQ